MEKHVKALSGDDKRKIKVLCILAVIAFILVVASIVKTIQGGLWTPVVGVVFACAGCICLEEADKIEKPSKDGEVKDEK